MCRLSNVELQSSFFLFALPTLLRKRPSNSRVPTTTDATIRSGTAVALVLALQLVSSPRNSIFYNNLDFNNNFGFQPTRWNRIRRPKRAETQQSTRRGRRRTNTATTLLRLMRHQLAIHSSTPDPVRNARIVLSDAHNLCRAVSRRRRSQSLLLHHRSRHTTTTYRVRHLRRHPQQHTPHPKRALRQLQVICHGRPDQTLTQAHSATQTLWPILHPCGLVGTFPKVR